MNKLIFFLASIFSEFIDTGQDFYLKENILPYTYNIENNDDTLAFLHIKKNKFTPLIHLLDKNTNILAYGQITFYNWGTKIKIYDHKFHLLGSITDTLYSHLIPQKFTFYDNKDNIVAYGVKNFFRTQFSIIAASENTQEHAIVYRFWFRPIQDYWTIHINNESFDYRIILIASFYQLDGEYRENERKQLEEYLIELGKKEEIKNNNISFQKLLSLFGEDDLSFDKIED